MPCTDTFIIIILVVVIISLLKSYKYTPTKYTPTKKTETESFTDEWGYDYKSLKKGWKPKKTSNLKTLCPTKIDGKCVTY